MSIILLGDVFLDKRYNINFDYEKCIFNLEFSITDSNNPAKNKVNLKSEKSYIIDTFEDKVEAVSLANNHVFDFMEEGYKDTIKNLKNQNINYFGAGDDNNNYNNPYLFYIKDKKIAILGYNCSSTNPSIQNTNNVGDINKDNIINNINLIRKDVDFIILYLHWGIEEIPFPKYSDTQLARQLIDNGADLIVGQHSHVIQSYEIYKNKHIFYGIGNFIFPDLNHDSNYNGIKYTSTYIKKQEQKHLRSIVVSLNSNLEIEFFTVELQNNSIFKKNFRIPNWIPKSENDFEKRLKYQRKINMIKKMLKNPKLPNFEQLFRFLGIK